MSATAVAVPTIVQAVNIPKFIVNFTDAVFRGYHHGKKKHEDDFEDMLKRSQAAGLKSMIITGGSLPESREALELSRQHGLYTTVGCHPTRSGEFEQHTDGPDGYLKELDELIEGNLKGKGRVVCVGECGLDYDRTHFAAPDIQQKYFRLQLSLAKRWHLPLFLHSRAAHTDLVSILREEGFGEDGGRGVGANSGVVHSFTGTVEEAVELINMGFYIGLNGCSLKTEANLVTAKSVPVEKLMLETDAPWCSMTSTQASRRHLKSLPPPLNSLYFPQATKPESFVYGKPVKGRNEPSAIGGVAWVVSQLHGIALESLADQVWRNTVELFGLEELQDS
ncbi:uncharacterized protein PHACADRAFT_168741 [Phanerochaete carnosa HHB-10118-sp]|uniref:Mg-dependent DNase n=1 Tax=Phanerochaete carnosa (strain HHB-10118-sp) TaxID=650164 RepID=K5XE57_PHACS|nr:uncharacterized protein PHACADRAFT_168741 [Phanerochaete carnosa HHB-10118-sp]EKM61307.1 hypothetical protein PHACADRAFT_168741 [Phanerochaete carnosa HHB-10118-sp]